MISPSYTDFTLPGVAEDALLEFDRHERAGTLEDWARKWGREMAMFVVENPIGDEDPLALADDLKDAEQEVSNLRSDNGDLMKAIQSAIETLEAAL